MQAAAGGVSWVAAPPSVLGRCGGAPARGTTGRGGGGGRGLCVARCCARVQAQEKRPPRGRKTKEERRELVESFINSYRVSNDGKFPSVNLTHKEVGGSYYIVREIVRDIIQENRVLGPGGLNSTALSFEDCQDSSELSMKHELGKDAVEISDVADANEVENSVLETNSEELISLQMNPISAQTLLASSDILEVGVLNGAVQNGNATRLQTSLEKQNEVSCEKLRETDLDSSEEQAASLASMSNSDKEPKGLGDAHEGKSNGVIDGVILSSEHSVVSETDGALFREHKTLHKGSHDGSIDNAVSAENLLEESNRVIQTSVSNDDTQIIENQFNSAIPANSLDGFNSSRISQESEDTTKPVELHEVHRMQDVIKKSLLDGSPDEHENSGSLVSHPSLHTEGSLLREGKHSTFQVDESGFMKSTPGITKEETEASNARHEQGPRTTTAISRINLKAKQKKEDNLFWLVLRAFIIAVSKLWSK